MRLGLKMLLLLLPEVFFFKAGYAQTDSSAAKQYWFKKVVFNFDNRNSFINDQRVQISGIKLGIEWKNRLRTGVGFYFLSPETKHNAPPPDDNVKIPIEARIRFSYFALYGEYVFIDHKRWELSAPVQFGLGTAEYYFPERDKMPKKRTITLIEPSISAHYKIFPWIGVGVGAGYRQMLGNSNNIEHNLDAPIYYGKVKIFPGAIVQYFSRKKDKN